MSILNEFAIIPLDDLENLTNPELLDYKIALLSHGQDVEAYVESLKDIWKTLHHILKDRVSDLEYELAWIQAERSDYELDGSGNPSDFYIN